ncbi:MAG: L,D-transpeptidase, partial [Aestuariivirga sp.]
MHRRLALGAAIIALTGLVAGSASAKKILLVPAKPQLTADRVDIMVDKVSQHMRVSVGGVQRYDWLVSTGGQTYDTPSGNYHIFRMEKDHFSKEWDDAPMPYSMFFT